MIANKLFLYIQDVINSSTCNDSQEPTNANEDINRSSNNIKVLKVFQDILVYRMFTQSANDLGKVFDICY